jgi:type I restriction enzyme, S subunit
MLDKAKNKGDLLPYLANINVRWGEFDLADLREMRFEPHEIERYSVRPGDILMCEGGEPGRCAPWKGQRENMMFQKALHRIRPHLCLDRTFLYYAFLNTGQSNGFAPYFTGATIKHLPREQLAKVPIRFPDLRTQQAIASVLSAYDDLIATNQRRIALLEAATRRLYREWFVHLRFPGHESVPVRDGVPEGWKFRPLGEIAPLNYGKALKASDRNAGVVPVYGSSGIVGCHNQALIGSGAIILGRKGNVGSLYYSATPCFPIDTVFYIEPDLTTYRLYLALHTLNFISSDAAVPGLNRTYAQSLPLLIPSEDVSTAFESVVSPMFEQAEVLRLQNAKLTRARDLLLPKLMSGQLDVSRIQLPEQTAAE